MEDKNEMTQEEAKKVLEGIKAPKPQHIYGGSNKKKAMDSASTGKARKR